MGTTDTLQSVGQANGTFYQHGQGYDENIFKSKEGAGVGSDEAVTGRLTKSTSLNGRKKPRFFTTSPTT